MMAYDLCAVEWLPDRRSLFSDKRSVRVTGFNAAGELHILYMGEEKYNARSARELDAIKEQHTYLDARLLADGWSKEWPGSVIYGGVNFIAVYVRQSAVNPLQVKSVTERLLLLKDLLNAADPYDNRDTIQQLYKYAQDELSRLEQRNQSPTVKMVELLERLSKLHREGSISSAEFDQAKKKALGL